MRKIQIVTSHLPGWNSPEEWRSRVIYDDKLLETFVSYSEFELGSKTTFYQQKWDNLDDDSFQNCWNYAEYAFCKCDHCKSFIRLGGCSCLDKKFCETCMEDGTLDRYRAEFKEQEEKRAIKLKNEIEDGIRLRDEEAKEAMKSFHWRDNWFFKRLEDGVVQIVNVEKYHDNLRIVEKLLIPANEWASIVASVSASGETSEKYYVARDFHST